MLGVGYALTQQRRPGWLTPGAVLDLSFKDGLYYAAGPRAFANTPGLSASGGVNGTVTRNGVIVPASAPRIGDDGLLVEGAATERLPSSGDLSAAMWVAEAGTTKSAATGPVEGATAQRFTVASGNGRVQASPSGGISHTASQKYTCFMVGRPGPGYKYLIARLGISGAGNGFVTLAFDTETLSVAQSSAEHENASIKPLSDGYFLCRFEFTPGANTASGGYYFAGTDTLGASSGIFAAPTAASYYDFALISIMEGSQASPIVSTGTALTRTADSVTLTDLDALGLTSAVLAAGYTVVVEFQRAVTGAARYLFSGNDTTLNERVVGFSPVSSQSINVFVADGGVTQVNIIGPNVVEGAIGCAAFRFAPNNVGVSVNGSASQVDSAASLPSLTQLMLGRGVVGEFLSGTIRRLTIIPRAVSDAELQALSS